MSTHSESDHTLEARTARSSSASDSHADDIDEQVRIYLLVFGALAILTVLTVAVAYISLPFVPGLVLGLLIATVKGALVAGYFMHLLSEENVIYLVLAFTIVFLIGMIVLTSSSITVHRGVPGVP